MRKCEMANAARLKVKRESLIKSVRDPYLIASASGTGGSRRSKNDMCSEKKIIDKVRPSIKGLN